MCADVTGSDSDDHAVSPARPPLPEHQIDDPAFRVFLDSLSYLEPDEIRQVIDAYLFSEEAHRGQTRLSGEPYVTHPLAVAGALAEWRVAVTVL